jgi:hypothetical protein
VRGLDTPTRERHHFSVPERDDREHVLAKIVVAVAGSVGTHYVFERYLRVPLPDASLPALRSLGF